MVTEVNLKINEGMYIKSSKEAGMNIKSFPQLHRMVKKNNYSIEYTYNIYEVSNESGKKMAIAFLHGLNCIQYQADNAKELTKFLADKGYKTSKKFYMQELGMSEESWNEWNGIGVDEE